MKKEVETYMWRCYYCCRIIKGDSTGHEHKLVCTKNKYSTQER